MMNENLISGGRTSQNDVLAAIDSMRFVFQQYLNDAPESQRHDEVVAIRSAVDDFLISSFTLLPPGTGSTPIPCPRCQGKGTV
jgi:hypothetical protein